MTQYIYVIGYLIHHSISPSFQQVALNYHALDIKYEMLQVEPSRLKETVTELRHTRYLGANITIPFKEMILPLLDELDEEARSIGAVNTIVNIDGSLVGYNTDSLGFIQALQFEKGFDLKGNTTVILGAGGAARAICNALLSEGSSKLILVNRTRQRAEDLADKLRNTIKKRGLKGSIDVVQFETNEVDAALAICDLIVNCTSLGMKHGEGEKLSPLEENQIRPDVMVYDLVYNPRETPFLKIAAGKGAQTLDGLPMLVYQGAASFSLWTAKKAPVKEMFEAARKALC